MSEEWRNGFDESALAEGRIPGGTGGAEDPRGRAGAEPPAPSPTAHPSWPPPSPAVPAATTGGKPDGRPVKETVRAADALNLVGEVRGRGDTAPAFLDGPCGDREYRETGSGAPAHRGAAADPAGPCVREGPQGVREVNQLRRVGSVGAGPTTSASSRRVGICHRRL